MALEFHFAVRSDVGLLRKNNQDSAYAGSRLLAVADGMGGPAGGDIASSIVIGHLAPLEYAPGPTDSLVTNLADALQAAHDELADRSDEDRSLRGLGTTCTAILRSENKLAMVHIGDSRAYLLRDGNLVQVTSDHSLVQYLVDTGQITKEEAETHPRRHVVVKVIGDTPGPILADATVREAVLGDRWLLCSDGLFGVVSDETIGEVLTRISDLGACAEELVTLALRGGGPDNVTVLLADVVDVGQFEAQVPQIVGAAAVDRNIPTKGSTGAAGRAAALAASDVDAEVASDEETEKPPRNRVWLWLLSALVVIAVLVGGLIWGWHWVGGQFYAIGSQGKVVIYQGIPQNLGPWDLSKPIEITDLSLEDLSQVDRSRLEDPVMRSSLEEIEWYLDEVRARADAVAGRAAMAATPRMLSEPQSSDPSQSGSGQSGVE